MRALEEHYEIIAGDNQRSRVVDVVPFAEEDESGHSLGW